MAFFGINEKVQVVVFMITGFFDAPKPLTPALCKEIHDLCDK